MPNEQATLQFFRGFFSIQQWASLVVAVFLLAAALTQGEIWLWVLAAANGAAWACQVWWLSVDWEATHEQ